MCSDLSCSHYRILQPERAKSPYHAPQTIPKIKAALVIDGAVEANDTMLPRVKAVHQVTNPVECCKDCKGVAE